MAKQTKKATEPNPKDEILKEIAGLGKAKGDLEAKGQEILTGIKGSGLDEEVQQELVLALQDKIQALVEADRNTANKAAELEAAKAKQAKEADQKAKEAKVESIMQEYEKIKDEVGDVIEKFKKFLEGVGDDREAGDWMTSHHYVKAVSFYKAMVGDLSKLGFSQKQKAALVLKRRQIKGVNKYLQNREAAKKAKLELTLKRKEFMSRENAGKSVLAQTGDDDIVD